MSGNEAVRVYVKIVKLLEAMTPEQRTKVLVSLNALFEPGEP